jgi:N-acetylglucosamine kinase
MAIFGDDHAVTRRRRLETPVDDWTAFVDVFRAAQARHADHLAPGDPVSIALSGFIDAKTGLAASANVPCVGGRFLARDLAEALGRPVFVTNDADAFVLAEARLGGARGHRRVFGIILGTGVGGGLVENGRLVAADSGV